MARGRSALLNCRRRRFAAFALFFAFTAPCGIVAHLASEFAGLGWRDADDVAFSARHGYLALLALLSFVAVFAALRAVPRSLRRDRIAELVDALPFRGAGAGFAVVSFAAQFAFFAVTQVGEGCPLCSGDVVTGVFAAALAALLGAFALSFGKRRILALALALVRYLSAVLRDGAEASRAAAEPPRVVSDIRRSPFAFRYRPPPLELLARP